MTAPNPDFTGLADRIDALMRGDDPEVRRFRLWHILGEAVSALRHAADLEREVNELRRRLDPEFRRLLRASSLGDSAWIECERHGRQARDPFTDECVMCPAAVDQTGAGFDEFDHLDRVDEADEANRQTGAET